MRVAELAGCHRELRSAGTVVGVVLAFGRGPVAEIDQAEAFRLSRGAPAGRSGPKRGSRRFGCRARWDNSTRFLVIGRELLAPSGQDKTTVLISTSGTAGGAGVLHALLQPFATHGISMSRIESRPSRRKNWDYVFFIDVDGHAEESPLKEALSELAAESSLFRIVGAYPKAVR